MTVVPRKLRTSQRKTFYPQVKQALLSKVPPISVARYICAWLNVVHRIICVCEKVASIMHVYLQHSFISSDHNQPISQPST